LSTSTITELLARVSEIGKKHELIAEMTGERFNIFSILGLQSAENRTHSAFLRELLDPKGSHGMKDTFLKAFVHMLRKTHGHCEGSKLDGWDANADLAADVETELHIGYKSDDLSQGGRIDIVISPKSGMRRILIENKIYAGDQDCQLVRYHNHDPKALLLYLTLYGIEASEGSTKNQDSGQKLISGDSYFQISYKSDILEWLEECRKEASNYPLVRESIVQYANLIRNLTQQNTSDKMSEDIATTVLRDKETLLAYGKLLSTQDVTRKEIFKVIQSELQKLARQPKHEMRDAESEIDPFNQEFHFCNELLDSINLSIGFGVDSGRWFYGFARKDHRSSEPGDHVLSIIKKSFGPSEGATEYWPVCCYWKTFLRWNSDFEVLASIYFEKENSAFIKDVNEKLLQMKDMVRKAIESDEITD
jgi:hypothetical protein